jgi:hypothetical protein
VLAGGSITVGGTLDTDHGSAVDAAVFWSPVDAWSVSAGVGTGKSGTGADAFSGTVLRAGADVYLGRFNAGVSLRHWEDSSQLRNLAMRAQFGFTADSGLGVAAIIDDRALRLKYLSSGLLGTPRELEVDFEGTGFGAELSWIGMQWNAAAHYVDYDYGRSVQRVRAALTASDTTRFPRLQVLAASAVTRAAAATDRELGVTLGREFARATLQGDYLLLRDALTGEQTHSLSLTHGYRMSARLRLDTTLGLSAGDAVAGTPGFVSLAVTFGR